MTDGVDKYHREMAERERRGTEPGFKSQASSNRVHIDRCMTCGHDKRCHIYYEGACRPGFVCSFGCEKFVPMPHAIPNHVRDTYEPCVLDAEGNCTRWSHDHSTEHATRNREAEDEWQFTTESGNVFDLPFYRDGYVAGWRAAMTEAKGGDWSQETPDV